MSKSGCERCNFTGWVCEAHPDKPWEHSDCGAAGDPCPTCNRSSPHPNICGVIDEVEINAIKIAADKLKQKRKKKL